MRPPGHTMEPGRLYMAAAGLIHFFRYPPVLKPAQSALAVHAAARAGTLPKRVPATASLTRSLARELR